MPMIKNSTLFYVINDFFKDNNLLLPSDFFDVEIENSMIIKNLEKIEFSPPDDLIRKILIENL